MKKQVLRLLLSTILLLLGCSKVNNVTEPEQSNSTGKLSFKLERSNVPQEITSVSIKLTRSGFQDINRDLNLLTDSTAEILINDLETGLWHVKIDARNNSNVIKYSGETDVTVENGIIVQLNLTLNPVNSGVGSIYIFVTWGSNSQWIDYIYNPILTRHQNPSLPNCVSACRILYDNGIYKMWYVCIYNSAKSNIWYAESTNGITWNTIGNGPVLSSGCNTWDSYSVFLGAILKDNGTYKMFYLSYKDYTQPVNVGAAFSQDGIHWEKVPNPIIYSTSEYYNLTVTDAIKKEDVYYLFFNTQEGKIGVATSKDLITWQKKYLFQATQVWENGDISYPSVIYEDGLFKMVYQNSIEKAFGYATASSDLFFTKNPNPIFRTQDARNSFIRIAYPHFRKVGDEYRIYYAGEDYNGELTLNFMKKK